MKTPGALYRATHEQLDDIGCYAYTKPRIGKNGLNLTQDPYVPVYVPVGAVMMYVKSSLHKTFYEDEQGETQFEDTWFDVCLYKDKFVEFESAAGVLIPVSIPTVKPVLK